MNHFGSELGPVFVAIIAAIAGLLTSAFTYLLTKLKEREADWRKEKLEYYKAFLMALNAMVGPPASMDDRVRFANAANNIYLFGSPDVLVALRAYLDVTAASVVEMDRAKHDILLTKLMVAIRADVAPKGKAIPHDYLFRLWAGR